jgi:ubiquitin-activating enzyme E1-like protein 2
MPHSIEFDPNNELHLTFVMSCAQLIAIVNNIHIPSDEDQQKRVIDVINSISIPEFIPKQNKTIITDASVTAPIDSSGHKESQTIDELKRQTYSKDDDLQLKCIYALAVSHYLLLF